MQSILSDSRRRFPNFPAIFSQISKSWVDIKILGITFEKNLDERPKTSIDSKRQTAVMEALD